MRGTWFLVLAALGLGGCGRDPDLGPPVTIAARDAANPTVAVDGRSGRVYVSWVQMAPDSSWDVFLAAADSGAEFGPPVRVNDRPGEAMVARENPPQVLVGADGVVYVGWVSARTADDAPHADVSLRLARSTDGGGTFSPAASLDADPAVPSLANMYFDLATAPGGAVYASWLDLHYYTDSVAARALGRVSESIPVPEHRVDLVVARTTDDGAGVAAAAVLDTSSCICCRTALAVAPDGAVHALWRHVFPGDVRDFQAARSADGAVSFTPPARVHEDGWVLRGCPDIGPDIAVDARGAVHAAWYTGVPGRVGLWYATSADGGQTFDAPVALLPTGHVSPSQVKLAAAGGTVWGAWEDRRRPPTRVIFGRPGTGSTTQVGTGEFPGIAAAGRVVVVTWMEAGAVRARRAELPAAD
jgi:hypothetical protein